MAEGVRRRGFLGATLVSTTAFAALPADAAETSTDWLSSRSQAAESVVPTRIRALRLLGFGTPHDGGGALYARARSEPAHLGKFRTQDRFTPSGETDPVNGGWWEIAEPVVDPRMFGAICDGVSDDTDAVLAAATLTGIRGGTSLAGSYNSGSEVSGSRTLAFTAGRSSTYTVSREIHLYSGAAVRIDKGAQIRALPNFQGEAVFAGPPLEEVARARNVTFASQGVIHCGGAGIGILVRRGNNWDIQGGRIVAARLAGIQCGQPAMDQERAFEIYIDGVLVENFRSPGDTGGGNDASSIGISLAHATDCRVSRSVVMGYRTGARSDLSSNSFTDVHAWTSLGLGPMEAAFVALGRDVKFINCTADSPTSLGEPGLKQVYGFRCGPGSQLLACTVMLNGDAGARDGECIAVEARTPDGATPASVAGGFTIMSVGKTPRRYLKLFDGTQASLEIADRPRITAPFDAYGVLPLARGGARDIAPNRDFSLWQRGDGPFPCAGSGCRFVADRWHSETDAMTGDRDIRRVRAQNGGLTLNALQISQRTPPGDGTFWSVGARFEGAEVDAARGRTLNLSCLVRSVGSPTGEITVGAAAALTSGSTIREVLSPTRAPIRAAFQRIHLRMPLPEGAAANEVLTVRLLLPAAGRWRLELAAPSIWPGDEWVEWTSPAPSDVMSECLAHYEVIAARAAPGGAWIGCAPKRAAPRVSTTRGTADSQPTKNGVLLFLDRLDEVSVIFDAEL